MYLNAGMAEAGWQIRFWQNRRRRRAAAARRITTCPREEGYRESKFDLYSKDRMFFTSFAFFVITFEPIMI